MPRARKADAQQRTVAVADNPAVSAPQTKKVVRKRDWFEDLKLEDCEPYTFNTADLEDAEVIWANVENRAGHTVSSRTIYCGRPLFYLERCVRPGGDWYNLIAVYKNGKGVGQRNIRTFKPKDANRLGGASPFLIQRAKDDTKWVKFLVDVKKVPVRATGSVS